MFNPGETEKAEYHELGGNKSKLDNLRELFQEFDLRVAVEKERGNKEGILARGYMGNVFSGSKSI